MHVIANTLRTALAALAAVLMLTLFPTVSPAAQEATPDAYSCADAPATPSAGMAGMSHGGTPDANGGMHDMDMPEFDLMYIDMMIPHHESIIALAQVALPELTDPRLIDMAEGIIDSQSAENETMQQLRDDWYPGAEPASMDQMMAAMPGMGSDMEGMTQQMSAEGQVQAFCAAEDKDLAFIEQVIPHHQMAIDTSQDALEHAVHPELVTIAEQVIAAQEQEIDLLDQIRAELAGGATPAS